MDHRPESARITLSISVEAAPKSLLVESAVRPGSVAAGTPEAWYLGADQATHGSDINRRGNKSLFIFPPDKSEVTIVAGDAWIV
jgi:hypothetical protein